ncbi:MAG: hypothetical protein H7Y37_18305 [Anaerolineae bacterium]|nr:hypothetical protein [Gloeobacterales cyanobacterium ES-bin-313]
MQNGSSATTVSKLARNQIDRFDGKTVTLLCQYFKLKSLADLIEIDPSLPDYGDD